MLSLDDIHESNIKVIIMSKHEWKKTLKRGGRGVLYVLVCGLISIWQGQEGYMALIPVLEMARTYLKYEHGLKILG